MLLPVIRAENFLSLKLIDVPAALKTEFLKYRERRVLRQTVYVQNPRLLYNMVGVVEVPRL